MRSGRGRCAMCGYARRASVKKIQITAKQSPTFGGYSCRVSGSTKRSWKGIWRARSQGSEKRGHRRSAACAEERPGQSRILVRLLYSQAGWTSARAITGCCTSRRIAEGKRSTLSTVGVGGNDPGSVTDASLLGNSFLMPQGYSISFSGWDFSAETNGIRSQHDHHAADRENPDGSSITGPSLEYIVNRGASYALTYPAATLDRSKATLTHRVHLNDAPQVIPESGWQLTRKVPRSRSCLRNVVCAERYL